MRIFRTYGLLIFVCLSANAFAQSTDLEGEVSFVTSENTYVRFLSTADIEIGDTLSFMHDGQKRPCLIVQQKSSSSCVCSTIGDCKIEKGTRIYFAQAKKVEEPEVETEQDENKNPELNATEDLAIQDVSANPVIESNETKSEPVKLQKIRARLSASTYSTLNPDHADRHRTMLRFNMNADRINNSRLSFETNINYRRNIEESTASTSLSNNFMRIYNLAVRFQLDSLSTITLGRKINRKMSSVGAIDGVQLDKYFNSYYTGAILGFRPDISDFGFNPDLFEYGVYFGKDLTRGSNYGNVTLGFLEQRNAGNIDRRYSYLQFSNSFSRKASMFASMEMDLYSFKDQTAVMEPRLTNLFLSFRYRFNRRFSVSLSYDTRKRIIYYETFRTEIDELLADDLARQGIRLRVNIRPMKYVYTGFSVSRRFQSNSQNSSDNANAFVNIGRVPKLNGRLNFSFNYNKSNYLKSYIKAVRYSRMLIPRKVNVDLYYRHVNYNYISSETKTKQEYYGAGLSWNISKDINLNILLERSISSNNENYRFNTKLIKRFK